MTMVQGRSAKHVHCVKSASVRDRDINTVAMQVPMRDDSKPVEPPDQTTPIRRWPEIDIWFVVVVLLGASIVAILTFELWVPH